MSSVKYGLYVPNYGRVFGYAKNLAELAQEAEDAGWDGFYLWDHIVSDRTGRHPMVDPWVSLAAMALNTKQIRIGTTVTPVPRRRPWKLAREAVSVDQLSDGRLTLGVGLGFPPVEEFEVFGEDSDTKTRAEMLDEGLDVLFGLWSGRQFSYEGKHYKVDDVRFKPRPVQKPRIPIWAAGTWPNKKPFMRAADMDGIIPLRASFSGLLQPEDYVEILEFIDQYRTTTGSFDVACIGKTSNTRSSRKRVSEYTNAGVNWWLEYMGASAEIEKIRERIQLGPIQI